MKRTLTSFDLALWAALPMAHTPKIEGRISMILDRTRRRILPRRAFVFGVAVTAAALIPLSMLRPAARAQTPPQVGASSAQARAAEREKAEQEMQYVRETSKFQRGEKLTPEAAAVQEQQLAVQPDDYTAHLCLLGYYLNSTIFGKPLPSPAAQLAYRQQIFWLIQNRPESLLFSREPLGVPRIRAKALFAGDRAPWEAQFVKHPNNPVVLGNAAGYYLLSDKAAAEKYLLQAQALEPRNPVWASDLGELYRLQGPNPSPAAVRQSAIKALAEYETAAALSTNKTVQHSTSADLAKTAFDAGEYDKAGLYASRLLERGQNTKGYSWDPAGDIHEADMVLGRLALHDGDTAGAEAYLLAMGHVSGAGTLDSFGPNMQLAADLLKIGRRDTVLAYFDECAKFWKDKQLSVWRSEVQQGKMPDFRGNLDY